MRPSVQDVYGQAHGFDRATGKPVWVAQLPAAYVDFQQPANVPVLVLRTEPSGRPPGRVRNNAFSLSLLDLRNGQIVYRDAAKEPLEPFAVRIDRRSRKIEVQTSASHVELTLTDIPLSDPPPELSRPPREPVRALKPGEKNETSK